MKKRKTKEEKLKGGRLFTCNSCHDSFTRKDNLRRHIKMKRHFYTNEMKKLPVEIEEILPDASEYPYRTLESNEENFRVILTTVFDENSLQEWVRIFSEKVGRSYVRSQTGKNRNRNLYYCEQHGRKNRIHPDSTKKSKVTGCMSRIFAVFRYTEPKHTNVRIHFRHNHPMTLLKQSKLCTPYEEVQNRLKELFKQGLGPSKALQKFRDEIHASCKSDSEYVRFISDKRNCPDYYWVWCLHKKLFNQSYELKSFDGFVEDLNGKFGEKVVLFQQYDSKGHDFAVAIATPFMKRVCNSSFAGKTIFLDNAGSAEKAGLRVFLLLCKTSAGGAPIGVFVTTNQTADSIEKGLRLLLTLYDENSFGGRGLKGPLTILSTDSASEAAAIKSVFYESKHLFCTFHIIQAWRKWLKKIPEDRNVILFLLKRMLYAFTENDLHLVWTDICQKYEQNVELMQYLREAYEKKETWALCYRKHFFNHDCITNSIVERNVRDLKENILERSKKQCIAELVTYLSNGYNQYYLERFIDCTVGNSDITYPKIKPFSPSVIDNYAITPSSQYSHVYTVFNKKKNITYDIDREIGICSCFNGQYGANCKHQQILETLVDLDEQSSRPMSENQKEELLYIAAGDGNLREKLFESIEPTENVTSSTMIEIVLPTKNPENYIMEEIEFLYENDGTLIDDYEDVVSIHSNEIKEDNLNESSEHVWNENDKNFTYSADLQNLKFELEEFISIIAKNPHYYQKGIQTFRKSLQTAMETPTGVLNFLCSFQ